MFGGNDWTRTSDSLRMKEVHWPLCYISRWRPARDLNPDQRFWRPTCCHYTSETFLEHRVRFELTVLGICNPLHWAALPPVHIKLFGSKGRDRTYDQQINSLLHYRCATLELYGGPWESRTPYSCVQGRCVPNYTNSP